MEALTNRILPSLPQTVKIFAKISILSDISQVLLSAPACALLQGSWNRSSSCSSWNRSSSSFFGDSALLCALRDLCDEILPLLLRPGNSALPSCSRLRPASGFVESLFFVFLRFLRGIAFLRLPPVPSVIPLFSAPSAISAVKYYPSCLDPVIPLFLRVLSHSQFFVDKVLLRAPACALLQGSWNRSSSSSVVPCVESLFFVFLRFLR
jgi:hypothetical protein